jgi:hypothetical protein
MARRKALARKVDRHDFETLILFNILSVYPFIPYPGMGGLFLLI